MAEVVTYNSLLEDVRRYIERGFATDTQVFEQIPRLVAQAQRAICDKFKIQGNIEALSSNLVAGVFTYAKPDRWRETVSMRYGTGAGGVIANSIYPRSYEYCRMYAPDVTAQGPPEFYADYDYSHWIIVPTPIAAYPWEVLAYMLPPLIDASNQTNFITDYAPGPLLYRTLLEAAIFLKNDERIQTFTAQYEDSVSNLNVQDIKKIVDRNATRSEA